jgi:hypothetical protein
MDSDSDSLSTFAVRELIVYLLSQRVHLNHKASQRSSTSPTQDTGTPSDDSDVASNLSDVAKYQRYTSAANIVYTPELALEEGRVMLGAVEANIRRLRLGSERRKDVWIEEVQRYVFEYVWGFVNIMHSDSKIKNHRLLSWPFVAVEIF